MTGEPFPSRADLLQAYKRLAAAQDRAWSYRGDNVFRLRRLEADVREQSERVERLRAEIRRGDLAAALERRARRRASSRETGAG